MITPTCSQVIAESDGLRHLGSTLRARDVNTKRSALIGLKRFAQPGPRARFADSDTGDFINRFVDSAVMDPLLEVLDNRHEFANTGDNPEAADTLRTCAT